MSRSHRCERRGARQIEAQLNALIRRREQIEARMYDLLKLKFLLD